MANYPVPFEIRAAIAAAIEFGRHKPAVFIDKFALERPEMPEYCVVADYDPEKDGYWVWVEPIPFRERTTKMVPLSGDPGDEHQERS